MPAYDFSCPRCGPTWRIVMIAERDAQVCDCGAKLVRDESIPAAQTNKTGWVYKPTLTFSDGDKISTGRRYRGPAS